MNIKILLVEPYPNGMACTNRIHFYAKGLIELGNQVQIIIPKPTEVKPANIQNHIVAGKYEGVDFEYSCGSTIRGKSFFKKRILVLKGIIRATKIIIQSSKRVDIIILVSNSLGYILFFKLITKLLNIVYVQEKSELPFINRKELLGTKLYHNLYINYVYKLFDGLLVISKYLYNFFENKINAEAELLLVPIIVNIEDFSIYSLPEKKILSIVYCGSLSQQKDGILTIIRAFNKISDKFYNIKLVIIGDTNVESDKNEVFRLITKLGIKNKIILTGYVSKNELKTYLSKASLLVLAKPSSKQADSCFPTKLGEFLATGNPVVVTKTGEILNYLTNNKNAFLAEPNSVDSFADLMNKAITDLKTAKLIGESGQNVAKEKFDYRIHAKQINDYLEILKKKKIDGYFCRG